MANDSDPLDDRVVNLDDSQLVWTMLVLLGGNDPLQPLARAREAARTVFTEIAQRWLPLETVAAAFRELEWGYFVGDHPELIEGGDGA